MKFIKKLIAIIILLLILAFFARNIIAKYGAQIGARVGTGVRLSIGKVDIAVGNALLNFKNIKVMNPKGFPNEPMVIIPEIHADYEIAPIFKDKIHLKEVRFELEKMVIIKNKDGNFNFNKLTKAKEKQEGEPEPEEEKKPGKKREFIIDNLKLKIGTVVYKDMSNDGEPKVTTFVINLDEEYFGVDDPATIGTIIFTKIMMNTSLSALTGIDISSLSDSANAALEFGKKQLDDLSGSEAGKQTQDAINKAADSIKKLF